MSATVNSENISFKVEKLRGYCLIGLESELPNLHWDDLQAATNKAIDSIKLTKQTKLLVDLSPLKTINSGMIAALLRIWKSLDQRTRRFSVVCPEQPVEQAIRSAGLDKHWTLAESREEGAYDLGVSRRAELEQRELRLLAICTFPCAILAAISLISLVLFDESQTIRSSSHLAAISLSVLGLTTGVISVAKDHGMRRMLSGLSIAVSLCVLAAVALNENPISFKSPEPTVHQIEWE